MDEPSLKTILIVDDEPDIREVLGISLADMGYRVLEAENTAQAFEVFVKARPRIVVTGIKMPGGDGIELLRKIKHENPETEAIMITGHGDMNLAVRSLKYDATDFITKPINVDALEIAVNRALEKIAMRRQFQDYTRSLEQLVRGKTELQDYLASLGLMIGSISHGMKGLRTSLDGGLYLASSGLEKSDLTRAGEGCAAARLTAERIPQMVLDILYYAKERQIRPAPVQAADFAENLMDVIRPKIEGSSIRLEHQVDRQAGTMTVDADYLQAALINSPDNTVDACLKATDASTHAFTFSMAAEKDAIVFTIADDGIGMAPETREKMFTLFFSTKKRKDTGLGLFIAHRIVSQHGGVITVKSKLGEGTVFAVAIPRTPATIKAASP